MSHTPSSKRQSSSSSTPPPTWLMGKWDTPIGERALSSPLSLYSNKNSGHKKDDDDQGNKIKKWERVSTDPLKMGVGMEGEMQQGLDEREREEDEGRRNLRRRRLNELRHNNTNWSSDNTYPTPPPSNSAYREAVLGYTRRASSNTFDSPSNDKPTTNRRHTIPLTPPTSNSWAVSLASNLLTSVGIRPESVDVDVEGEEEYVRRLGERLTRERKLKRINEDKDENKGRRIKRGGSDGSDVGRRGSSSSTDNKKERKNSFGSTLTSPFVGKRKKEEVELSLFSFTYVSSGHREIVYGEWEERESIYDSGGGIRAERAWSTPEGGVKFEVERTRSVRGVSERLGRSVLLRTRSENNFVDDSEWMDASNNDNPNREIKVRGNRAFESDDSDEDVAGSADWGGETS
ncbi:hypothetical protein TL16_g01571 [Triparma laevis f. inornata]|uniref:Uncharacterized protein n=1 Tax=Triparma laevis f. inornata TaxID=1714386 RepID=A0A9W6ZJK8_9STRA|nr:hypothetical protein TL16_g01571 [Triparma laevis f. inornata]